MILTLATNLAFALVAMILGVVAEISLAIMGIARLILALVTSPYFINLPYTSGGIVEVGWPIVRDFANLGFALALLWIGLATALKLSEYEAKKTLPRLILMILLVNFSPVICGLIVDAANIVMNFFLGAIGDFTPIWNFAKSIVADVFNIFTSKFFTEPVSLEAVARASMMIVFCMLTGFFFLLYAALFIVRYVAIWILVILSPLAFFAYVFGKTGGYFKQWWNQFIQWTIIGIPASFFLYLSYQLLDKINTTTMPPPAPDFWGDFIGLSVIMNQVMIFMPVLVLLLFGFLMSLSSGAMGATAIISTGKKWGSSAANFAGRVAKGDTAAQRKISEKAGDFAKGAMRRAGREVLLAGTTTDILKRAGEFKSGVPGHETIFDRATTWAVRRAALVGKVAQAKTGDQVEKMKQDPTLKTLLANNDLAGMMTWATAAPLGLEQDMRKMTVASLIAKEKKEAGIMKVESINPEFMNKAGDRMAAGGLKGLLDSMVSDSPILARRKQFWLAMMGLPSTPEEKAKLEKNLESAHKDLLELANKDFGKLTVGDTAWLEQIKKDAPTLPSNNADLLNHLKSSLNTTNLGGIVDGHNSPLFDTLMAEHAERKTARGLDDEAIRKLSSEYLDDAHSAENFVKTRSDTDAIKVLNVQGPGVFKNLIDARDRIGVMKLDEIGQKQWIRSPYVGNNRHYFENFSSPITDKITDNLEELNKHIGIMAMFAKGTNAQLTAAENVRKTTVTRLKAEAATVSGLASTNRTEISSITSKIKSGKATEQDKLKLDVLRSELSAHETREKSIGTEMGNQELELGAIKRSPNYNKP